MSVVSDVAELLGDVGTDPSPESDTLIYCGFKSTPP
jgi:hypothetical protein